MSTLKVVADVVPESCDYLTAGKVYEAKLWCAGASGADIICDDGDTALIMFENCDRLNGGSWRIVE